MKHLLKGLIRDNRGDTNLSMMIIMVIVFVAFAIILAAIYLGMDEGFANGTTKKFRNIMGAVVDTVRVFR